MRTISCISINPRGRSERFNLDLGQFVKGEMRLRELFWPGLKPDLETTNSIFRSGAGSDALMEWRWEPFELSEAEFNELVEQFKSK